MKKLSLIFSFLPLLAFSSFQYNDDVEVHFLYFYNWSSFDKTTSYPKTPYFQVNSIDDLRSLYFTHTYSLKFRNPTSSDSGLRCSVPSNTKFFSDKLAPLGGNNITNSITCSTNSVSVGVSPLYFSELRPFYQVPISLYQSGYRGPGLTSFDSGQYHCINVDLTTLIPSVLASTNSAFAQFLISSLSSIYLNTAASVSSLSSISDNTAASASSLSSISDNTAASVSSLSSIQTNTAATVSSLSLIQTNTAASFYSLSSMSTNTSAFFDRLSPFFPSFDLFERQVNSLSSLSGGEPYLNGFRFNFDKVLSDLDRSNWSDFPATDDAYDFWVSAYQRGIPLVASLAAGFGSLSSVDPRYNGVSVFGEAFNDSILKPLKSLDSSVSNGLSAVDSSVDDVASGIASANSFLHDIASSLSPSSSENPLSFNSIFSGDFSSLINQLRHDHPSSTDPLNPDNPASPFNKFNPNFVGGGGSFGAFTTNSVLRPTTNAIDKAAQSVNTNIVDSANNISSNVVDSAAMLKEVLDRINEILKNLTTPNSGDSIAASVRIVDPVNGGRVLVDTGLESFDPTAYDWKSLIDGVSVVAHVPELTNLVDYTSYLEQLVSNTAPWRLWTDYEDMVNGSFSSIVSQSLSSDLREYFDDPNNDTELLSDNFWSYFTWISGRQASDIHSIASLFTNVSSVIKFANSVDWGSDSYGNQKNMFSVAKDVLASFPSKTAIEDYISQATNSASLVTSSTNFLSSVLSTNEASRIIDDFFNDRGSSLPSQLVLLRLSSPSGGDFKVFDVPINDQAALWSTLRASITVVFTLVNLLLLPKFVLMVFRLFIRLFNRSLPFLDTKS